ncbi:MAG: methyltransferase [Rhodospirillales bacterium]|jgi:ribosomal protein L11 methyltransferase|nr:methyltransferase [Rhodospirillales bacterium]
MSFGNRGFLWQIVCKVPAEAADLFEEYLRQFCFTVSSSAKVDSNIWSVEGFSEAEPDREIIERGARALANDTGFEAPSFLYDLQPPINWLAENLASFPPIRWERYFVHGSHYEDAIPSGVTPLVLNAGTAFGSGEHPTTGGCLLALDRLARHKQFKRPLDVGCGSGILSIAAAKTWNVPVLAADIDPESVLVTKANAKLNQVDDLIQSVCSDGYKHRRISTSGSYDLITANILARPLAKLAKDLSHALAKGGTAVISGIIERDIPWMVRVHRMTGLHLVEKTALKGWATLVLEKGNASRA